LDGEVGLSGEVDTGGRLEGDFETNVLVGVWGSSCIFEKTFMGDLGDVPSPLTCFRSLGLGVVYGVPGWLLLVSVPIFNASASVVVGLFRFDDELTAGEKEFELFL
jgi:hypothetical protein